METTHAITADQVAATRLTELAFLRGVAAQSWAQQMRTGVQFLTPESWSRLDIDERARRLAAAEAERLAAATLFFLDVRCSEAVLIWARESVGHRYELDLSMLPAAAGFLVWAMPVSSPHAFGEVIAVHWRVEDGGVRLAWWTDAIAALTALARDRGYSNEHRTTVLRTHGPLLYERERFLPFAVADALSIAPDHEQDAAVHGLTMATIGTWRLLAEGRGVLRDVPPTPAIEQQGPAAGVTDQGVRAASLPAGTDPTTAWETASASAATASPTGAETHQAELITRLFGPTVRTDRPYPHPLPPELARWHCYLVDAGHCIAVAVQNEMRPAATPDQFLVPAPVLTVLGNRWTTRDGYIVMDLPVDPVLGLISPAEDYEF